MQLNQLHKLLIKHLHRDNVLQHFVDFVLAGSHDESTVAIIHFVEGFLEQLSNSNRNEVHDGSAEEKGHLLKRFCNVGRNFFVL